MVLCVIYQNCILAALVAAVQLFCVDVLLWLVMQVTLLFAEHDAEGKPAFGPFIKVHYSEAFAVELWELLYGKIPAPPGPPLPRFKHQRQQQPVQQQPVQQQPVQQQPVQQQPVQQQPVQQQPVQQQPVQQQPVQQQPVQQQPVQQQPVQQQPVQQQPVQQQPVQQQPVQQQPVQQQPVQQQPVQQQPVQQQQGLAGAPLQQGIGGMGNEGEGGRGGYDPSKGLYSLLPLIAVYRTMAALHAGVVELVIYLIKPLLQLPITARQMKGLEPITGNVQVDAAAARACMDLVWSDPFPEGQEAVEVSMMQYTGVDVVFDCRDLAT